MYWAGSMQHPNISRFPRVDNAIVRAVSLSSQMDEIWAQSTLID